MSAGNITGGAITGASIGSKTGPLAPFAMPIGAGLGALFGWLSGRKGDKQKKGLDTQIQQLIQMQLQRMQSQQPLYDAVTQTAYNRIPAIYRQGLTPPSPTSYAPTGDPMQDLLRMQQARMQTQRPLYDALQHLTQSRLNPSWR